MMKRLFIATKAKLSEEFTNLSGHLQQNMQFDKVTWVQADLQHITIRFLGKTPEYLIPPLCEILSEIVAQSQPFNLQLDKLGVFGSKYAPTALWFGFNEFAPLKKIFQMLETQLLNGGFEPQQGNFVPHLTIGRIKQVDNKKRFWELIEKSQPIFSQPFLISELLLMQSKLSSTGPSYTTLQTFPLQMNNKANHPFESGSPNCTNTGTVEREVVEALKNIKNC